MLNILHPFFGIKRRKYFIIYFVSELFATFLLMIAAVLVGGIIYKNITLISGSILIILFIVNSLLLRILSEYFKPKWQ